MTDRIHLRKNMAATSRAQYAVTDTIIAHAEELGLPVTALASGSFPAPWRWPERRLR